MLKFDDMKPGIYYMAHPYTGDRERRFKLANQCMSELIKRGYVVHSPITHTHNPQNILDLQVWGFWIDYDIRILEHMKDWTALILCPGWEKSKGCIVERKWFEDHDLPILYYEDLIMVNETEEKKEWVCPRCYYQNSSNNEFCMGAEMGDGRCGHEKPDIVSAEPDVKEKRNIDMVQDCKDQLIAKLRRLEFHGHPEFYELLGEMASLHSRKNHDYAGEGGNPLRNFYKSKEQGVEPWRGVMLRLSDKWSRLESFCKQGDLEVTDESVEDTLMDNAVYSLIAIILRREEKG